MRRLFSRGVVYGTARGEGISIALQLVPVLEFDINTL